jgi:hypothetical protein
MTRIFSFLLVLTVAAIGGFLLLRPGKVPGDSVTPLSFDGDSGALQQTAVVPTLDTPMPKGKSVIWCASFQLCWDKLRSDVVKGPIEITNAKEICDRLNSAPPAAGDLPAEAYFAAAGRVDDGIGDTIRSEMARRFPKAPKPEFLEIPGGLVAYAWLEANIVFGHPYLVNPATIAFGIPGAEQRNVRNFGVPTEYAENLTDKILNQCGALFAEYDDIEAVRYAVDLDLHSHPHQIVLARVDRKGTLGETFSDVQRKIRTFDPAPDVGWKWTLTRMDTLWVPNMHWQVQHKFSELLGAGKALRLNGEELPIVEAEQMVRFRLDSNGAGLSSSAKLVPAAKRTAGPRHFHFDRPFLLYIKKRDAELPFFVMWVDNAELLSRSGS